jgi:hypothetical protein
MLSARDGIVLGAVAYLAGKYSSHVLAVVQYLRVVTGISGPIGNVPIAGYVSFAN